MPATILELEARIGQEVVRVDGAGIRALRFVPVSVDSKTGTVVLRDKAGREGTFRASAVTIAPVGGDASLLDAFKTKK
jgi:hypothetical protein